MAMEDMYSKPVERSLAEGGDQGSGMGGILHFQQCAASACDASRSGCCWGSAGFTRRLQRRDARHRVRIHGEIAARRQLFPVRHRPRPLRVDGDRALRGGGNAAGFFGGRHARPDADRLASSGGAKSRCRRRGRRGVVRDGRRDRRFLSPSSAPYAIKAGVAILSCVLLLFYFLVLGCRKTLRRVAMQLDRNRIVIRERGWLDLLDLALRVIRVLRRAAAADAGASASCRPCCSTRGCWPEWPNPISTRRFRRRICGGC